MDDIGFILATYIVTFAGSVALAWYYLRRGRKLGAQLAVEDKPWILSPRVVDAPVPAPPRRNQRKLLSIGLLAVVLIAGGVVVTKFLTSSLDYYCNVDEVGVKSGCEAGRRLRIQGTVEQGSVQIDGGQTNFVLTFNEVKVPVVYEGEPGGVFQECIPVVVHGVMDESGVFDGDEVEVKHSNEYQEQNQDRLDDAESVACAPQP